MSESPAITAQEIRTLRRKVWRHYRSHGRHDLPFRRTRDPYRIAVSEIMLQQTGVERVRQSYTAWIKRWPSWSALAKATPRQLLTMWSGLGYNRRALYLGSMARIITKEHCGALPLSQEALRALPGIGPYSAAAILIFATNAPVVTVDINVRRVILSELGLPSETSHGEVEKIAKLLLPRGRSREWHYAMMDYGSDGLSSDAKRRYRAKRQSPFVGSVRQARGEIIRQLTLRDSFRLSTALPNAPLERSLTLQALEDLSREEIIAIRGNTVRLVSAFEATKLNKKRVRNAS